MFGVGETGTAFYRKTAPTRPLPRPDDVTQRLCISLYFRQVYRHEYNDTLRPY